MTNPALGPTSARGQSPGQRARELLRHGHRGLGAEQALALAGELQAERHWSVARQVLELADAIPEVDPATRRRLRQQLAVCTYKDTELRLLPSLERGLEVLASCGEDLRTTKDPETLGIAGAIHKRIWEVSGRRRPLVLALGYYLRGAEHAEAHDQGYTAINAAFVLDLLADLDSRAARQAELVDEGSDRRHEQAAALRQRVLSRYGRAAEEMLATPSADGWWLIATVAEAAFGLGDVGTARKLLAVAHALPKLPDWQLESTVRQLTTLARLRSDTVTDAEAAQVVAELTGRPVEHVEGIVGRVGLALSGGGFRASFFHLGALARLAELDVLRHVEVLSCVSGGSIVGAHYYLELRRRMQTRSDEQMSRAEYIDIVRTVQRDFYAATRQNLRRRALTNPLAIARSLFVPGYNRTVEVGRLISQLFYRPLLEGTSHELGAVGINPLGGPRPFDPRHHNWRRSAKAPLLIINATSLNTGHNWQFTTSWMGEPYGFIDERTDANYRLARIRFDDPDAQIPGPSIGQAVAASASVPGLLDPLPLDRLYPGKSVRLVDGGVSENQGIYGLLEQDCTTVIVSDASGQMNADDRPKVWPWSTMRRSNSILMATVRSSFFRQLDDLRRAGRLRGMLYLHLKSDLHAELVTQNGRARPGTEHIDAGRTCYGIPRHLQRHLAGMRTDLNVFSRAEVYLLMLSGYRMTAEAFPRELPDFPTCGEPPTTWEFQVIQDAADAPAGSAPSMALDALLHLGK